MRKYEKVLITLLLTIVSVFTLIVFSDSVSAMSDGGVLMKKALANGLKKCYSTTYMKSSSGNVVVTPSNTKSLSGLITSAGMKDGVIQVPTNVGNTLKDADLSCEQLFTGWDGGSGTGKSPGLLSSSNIAGKALLEKLDYQPTSSGNDTVCVSYTYDISGGNNSQTNRLCFPVDASGKLNINMSSVDDSTKKGRLTLYLDPYDKVRVMDDELGSGNDSDVLAFTVSRNMSRSDFESAANSGVKAFNNTSYYGGYASNGKSIISENASENIEYVLGDAENAMRNLTGFNSWSEAAFTDQDKYNLYMTYLKEYYKLTVTSNCSSDKNASQTSVPVKMNGEVNWCTLSGDMNSSKNANIVYSSESGFNETGLMASTRVGGVIEAIRALDVGQIDLTEANPDTGDIDDTVNNNNSSGSDSSKECYSHSGALGWLICPIIKGVSEIGEKLWQQIEDYHMKIPARDLFQGESGARSAWETVRNIANILFVILFMIVIFSQLTGIGIDNYGIKKILPKLIVVAVLINLSYIICELVIDLSNVAGVGINDLLSNAAGTAGYGSAGGSTGGTVAATGVLAALGGGAAALWVYLNPLGIVALGLAVLGIVITVAVAVFFIYIILVIREAGVILLVVLSPIAIACYLLPNTEKIYKKWFDLFKALLIVYPLCGAMIGAGKLAGAVLSQIDQPSMKVAAMIVQVLPFFLIPMLLRSSLSLMGNIGTRLTNMGRNLGQRGSRAAQGAVRNTDYAKRQQENLQASRAQRIKDRLERRGFENLNDNQKRRLNEAQRTVNAHKQRQAEANVAPEIVEQRAESARDATAFKAYQDQFAGFDRTALEQQANSASTWVGNEDAQQRMAALIGAMEANGMEDKVFEMLRNNDVSAMPRAMRALAGSKNYLMQAYGKKGAGRSFNAFEQGDGLRDYIAQNGIGSADKDSLQEINDHSTISVNPANSAITQEMAMHGAITSTVPKVRTQMNRMISQQISSVANESDLESSLRRFNIRAEDFAAMSDDTATEMRQAIMTRFGKTEDEANNILRSAYAPQIAAANGDTRISNKISGGVRSVFFPPSAPTGGPNPPGPNPPTPPNPSGGPNPPGPNPPTPPNPSGGPNPPAPPAP